MPSSARAPPARAPRSAAALPCRDRRPTYSREGYPSAGWLANAALVTSVRGLRSCRGDCRPALRSDTRCIGRSLPRPRNGRCSSPRPRATPTALNTAILHGIPEDTDWTVAHLSELGVDAVVCEAVDLLTRRSGEPYTSCVRRVCDAFGTAGETARLVMVADLEVSLARTDSDALRERYESSLPLLQGALATSFA